MTASDSSLDCTGPGVARDLSLSGDLSVSGSSESESESPVSRMEGPLAEAAVLWQSRPMNLLVHPGTH